MSGKTYVSFKTNRGVAVYPRLDKAYSFDMGKNRSMPDPDGQLETGMTMSSEDAEPLIASITEAVKKSGITPEHLPYKVDKETKTVTFKLKAYGKTKEGVATRIPHRDGKANMLPSSFTLTAGSEFKASGYISVARKGARLNLKEIQVLKYVPAASTFEAEDDGWVYEGEPDNNNEMDSTIDNDAGTSKDLDF